MKPRFLSFVLRSVALFVLTLLLPHGVSAQSGTSPDGTIFVSSNVVDSETRSAVTGARVQLLRKDSSIITGTIADKNGFFTLRGVPAGEHTLLLQSVGFSPKYSKVTVPAALIGKMDTLRLPPQRMTSNAVKTGEVEVSTTALRAEVRGDTTEFNAKAFKSDKNAAAEDVIRKMPGVEVDANGTVKTQGENVRRVLVDGKPFFGDDPTAALRNLPAEIIDRVQVIDQMSDQASFTRFDDGDRTKTLNIITNPNKRNGQFGKVYAGYGSNTDAFESRYTAGGNMNFFNGDRRISLLGMSNNINQQNFAIQDILGLLGGGNNNMARMMGSPAAAAAMRSGGGAQMFRGGGGGGSGSPGDFLVPQSDGITQSHGLGLNYSDSWGKNVTATGSYFVNITDNAAQQSLQRQYFLAGVPPQTSTQATQSGTQNMNHRVNMRIEATLDSSNSLIFTPRLTLQTNNRLTYTDRATFIETLGSKSLLNTTDADNTSKNFGYSLGGDILWRHKFPLEGRTLSINISPSYNRNQGAQINNSTNGNISFLSPSELLFTTVRQETPIFGNTVSLGSNVSYTEPLGDKGSLQASYNLNWSNSESDRSVFDFNTSTSEYSTRNVLLSNKFTSSYMTHRPGVSYRYAFATGANFSVGVDYQAAFLGVAQQYPSEYTASNSFMNVLPSANFTMRFGRTGNFRFNYRTSTNAPSISQLQTVLNNSDPLRLSIGNSDLKQEYTHSFSANYGMFDVATANSMFFAFGVNFTDSKIVNNTTIATRDTLILPEVRLGAGGQLTRPKNENGYWNARAFGTYSFPWEVWQGAKLNINLGAGFTYTRDISLINDQRNDVDNYGITPSLTLSSNISENLDFTVSGRSAITIARNSLQSSLDNTFFVHNIYARLNWIFWEGFLLTSDFTYISNNGLASGFNQSIPLLSVGLGKRFMEDKLEIKLSVFDALNQNTAISQSVTGSYIETSQTAVLRRYGLLTVTYNLRTFGM
ncbi:MAG: outer membrane beta-barrel protein [Candidatus Kapabacteria bacterium]|nr:outer membrane beta-barrel protein [Candidatus Kapabacteria bacterium]